MLFGIAVALFVGWLLGMSGLYTIGGFVHLLLIAAVVLFLAGLLNGRSATV